MVHSIISSQMLTSQLACLAQSSVEMNAVQGALADSFEVVEAAPSQSYLQRISESLLPATLASALTGCFTDPGTVDTSDTGTTGSTTDTDTTDTGMTDTGTTDGETDTGDTGSMLPAPNLELPIDGQELAPTRAFLRWEDVAGATSYESCYKIPGNPDIECPNSEVTTTPYRVIDPLFMNTIYSWWVRACAEEDGQDCGEWSEFWTIQTDMSVRLWLRLDDMMGDIADDDGPAGYDGMLTNFDLDAAWVTGIIGSALQFDGSDDYVTHGNVHNLDSSDAFSIEAWTTRSTVGNDVTILGRQDLSIAIQSRGYWLGYKDTNQVWFQMINDASSSNMLDVLTMAPFDTPNIPQNILVTYDGSSLATGVNIYIDTVDQPTTAPNDALSGTTLNPAPFRIGSTVAPGGDNTTTDFNFAGILDDIAVYNRVLSQAEAINNFCAREALNREETGDPSPLPGQCLAP